MKSRRGSRPNSSRKWEETTFFPRPEVGLVVSGIGKSGEVMGRCRFDGEKLKFLAVTLVVIFHTRGTWAVFGGLKVVAFSTALCFIRRQRCSCSFCFLFLKLSFFL